MKRLIRQSEDLSTYKYINEPESLSVIQDAVDRVTKEGAAVNFWDLGYLDEISDKISKIVANDNDVYDKISDYFLNKHKIDLEDDYEYQNEVIHCIYETAYELIDCEYVDNIIS